MDTFRAEEGDPWFVVTARRTTGQPTLDEWIESLVKDDSITFTEGYCPDVPSETRSTTLGGEPAELRGFVCTEEGPSAIAVQSWPGTTTMAGS